MKILRPLKFFNWRVAPEANDQKDQSTCAADTPINTAQEDLLGRIEFANAVAKVLYRHRAKESLVLALRGEWGSGKTSIKNLVVEALRSEDNPMKVVDFNPWQWDTNEAITRAFFREIAVALGDADKSLEGRERAHEFRRYAELLAAFSGQFKSVAGHSSNLLGWFGAVSLLLLGASLSIPTLRVPQLTSILLFVAGAVLGLSKIAAFFGREKEDKRPLDLARLKLQRRLLTLPRNILVVIDDIDRLEPEQIRLVMRHVKANANFAGLIYLLLFQRGTVESAFHSVDTSGGKAYLEKLIQIAFDVPIVEGARIEKILLEELQKLVDQLPKHQANLDQTRWANLWLGSLKYFFKNLRDVRRFIGGLEVQFILHKGKKVFEANLIDVIALEVIRFSEPEVFEDLPQSKHLLTSISERRDRDKEKEKATSILQRAKENRRVALQEVLKELFPPLASLFGGSYYGPDCAEEWGKEKRICSTRYFDRYFALRLVDDQISDSDLSEFTDLTGDKTSVEQSLVTYQESGLLPELLTRLDETPSALLPKHADVMLPVLFDTGERFPNALGFSFFPPFILIWRICNRYLKLAHDRTDSGELLLEAMRNSYGLAVPATLIGLDIDRRKKGDQPLILADAQLEEAKALWIEKISEKAQDLPNFILNPHLIRHLYVWEDFGDLSQPSNWVALVAADQSTLPKLLCSFVQERESHAFGEHVTQKHNVFELEPLLHFIDLASVIRQVSTLPKKKLDETQKQAIKLFLESAQKKLHEDDTTSLQ